MFDLIMFDIAVVTFSLLLVAAFFKDTKAQTARAGYLWRRFMLENKHENILTLTLFKAFNLKKTILTLIPKTHRPTGKLLPEFLGFRTHSHSTPLVFFFF